MGEPVANDNSSLGARSFVLGGSATNSDASLKVTSVLDAKTTLVGKLKVGSPTRIEGVFEGEIEATAPLEIGPTAEVRGKLTGTLILITGNFEGTLEVSERLILARKAVVSANVVTPSIAIEEGVTFVGKCEMPLPG